MNFFSIVYVLLLLSIVVIIHFSKDRYPIEHKFWRQQKWNSYDIILIIIGILVLQLSISFASNYNFISKYNVFIYGTFFYLIVIAIILHWILYYKYKTNYSSLGFSTKKLLLNITYGSFAFIIYTAIKISLILIVNQQAFLTKQISYFSHFNFNQWPITDLSIFIITAMVLAPVIEESVFRGFMYAPFQRKVGTFGSVCITSVVWSLCHLQTKSFFAIVILGFISGYLYVRTRSLIPCIVFHVLTNLFQFLLYFYLTV